MSKKDVILDGAKAFGLGMTQGIAADAVVIGAGNAIYRSLKGEEVTLKHSAKVGITSAVIMGVGRGIVGVITNKDTIAQREEIRKQAQEIKEDVVVEEEA